MPLLLDYTEPWRFKQQTGWVDDRSSISGRGKSLSLQYHIHTDPAYEIGAGGSLVGSKVAGL